MIPCFISLTNICDRRFHCRQPRDNSHVLILHSDSMPCCTRASKDFLQWLFVMCLFTFLETLSGDGILPQLVLSLVCAVKAEGNQTTIWLSSSPECNDSSKETVTEATSWYNVIVRDNNIAAMLTVTLLMATSDMVGRKKVMLIALLGMALDRLAIALSPSLSILHYVHTAVGLVFSRTLFYCVTFSAIADLSTHKTRSKDFSWLEAGMSLGMVIGPYGGGLLVKKVGLKTPFYVTCVGSIVLLVYVSAVLTESSSVDQRTRIVCGCHSISEYCLIPPTVSQETEHLISRDKTKSSLPQHLQTNWIQLTPFGSLLILFQSLPWLALTSMIFFDGLGHGGYTFIIPLYAKYQFNWGAYETVITIPSGTLLQIWLIYTWNVSGYLLQCASHRCYYWEWPCFTVVTSG